MLLPRSLLGALSLVAIVAVAAEDAPDEDHHHLKARIGETTVFDCPVEFPQREFEIPYMVEWFRLCALPCETIENELIYRRADGIEQHHGPYADRPDKIQRVVVEADDAEAVYGKGSIALVDVRPEDAGRYECRVIFTNRSPAGKKDGVRYRLEVEESPETTTVAAGVGDDPPSTDPSASSSSLSSDATLSGPVGAPENLSLHLTSNGFLLKWDPPTLGLERLRVYVVRTFKGPSKHLLSATECKETEFMTETLDEQELYHFQVSSLSMDDVDTPSATMSVLVPAYGQIKLVVAGVGCLLLVMLVGAIIWYATVKSREVEPEGGGGEKNGKSPKEEA